MTSYITFPEQVSIKFTLCWFL